MNKILRFDHHYICVFCKHNFFQFYDMHYNLVQGQIGIDNWDIVQMAQCNEFSIIKLLIINFQQLQVLMKL